MSLIRTRHNWILAAMLAVSFSFFLPTLFGALSLVQHYHPSGWLVFLPWVAWTVPFLIGDQIYKRVWRNREGAVSADEHGLCLNGRVVLTRKAIRHGNVMTEGDRTFLRLHRRAPFAAPYDIEVADESEARVLLANLRLDAQTSISEFELRAGTVKGVVIRRYLKVITMFVAFMGAVNSLRHVGEHVAIGLMWSVMFLGLYFMTSNVVQVSVGADGLRLKPVYGRSRFIAYSDLRDVRLVGKDLHLELADGSAIPLNREDEGPTLEARIREAMKLHRERNVNAAAAMNRGGRTTEQWLKATKERTATYREVAIPDHELWNVVEDAAASPTERAGAALALRTALDDVGRDRLRIAAGACAEKKLRVALESVAENASDEALEDLLEPLEDRASRRLKLTS